MDTVIKYTVIYDVGDGIEFKYLESDEDLSKHISEVIKTCGFDTDDCDFQYDLNKTMIVFDGCLKPKSVKVKPIANLEIKIT